VLTSTPATVSVTWDPSSIQPSAVSFSGSSFVFSGGVAYVLPNAGGTATVTGSFAGSDNGAHSSASINSTMTPAQFLAACSSAAGISSLAASGTLTLS
jgi:hypothetical protein